MSDSDCESANENTALIMDGHVVQVRPDSVGDRAGKKKKPSHASAPTATNRARTTVSNIPPHDNIFETPF